LVVSRYVVSMVQSQLQSFNLGFVQGSGLSLTLFLVLASNLNTLSSNNELIKFADDSTLWYQETRMLMLQWEFNHIQDWTKHNSMIINLGKTKEIIFYNPRVIPNLTPLPIFGIEQVSSGKLLGVYIQGNFSYDMHFNHIITVSSQRLHILKALRRQGLSLELLRCVFHAIIVNRITYPISA